MDEIVKDTQRVAAALGLEDSDNIVSRSELTMTMLLLRARAGNLWQNLIEPLLLELQKKSRIFQNLGSNNRKRGGRI
jgi:hypothetical protein